MNARILSQNAYSQAGRARFNPIRNLRPELLSSALDAFENGRLGPAVRIFESIIKRDDLIGGLYLKRIKSISRLESQIVMTELSDTAKKHRDVLKNFYDSIEVSSATDANIKGGLRLLIEQMMDSVAMRYAVHKIEFLDKGGEISGSFVKYPLWLFENTSGVLKILDKEGQLSPGRDLDERDWMTTCSDGLMCASSIAYLFKQLPLHDWLVYCERNGMPGIKATTDAFPGSNQWDEVCKAVEEFGAEFHAVLSQGTQIDAIDIGSRGELPYQAIIERMDRMLCALWRGADLSTLSANGNTGASVQYYESSILEEHDAANISEVLNRNVDSEVIKLAFGPDATPKAKFKLMLPDYEMHKDELEIIERLCALGLKPDPLELARKFSFPMSKEGVDDEV